MFFFLCFIFFFKIQRKGREGDYKPLPLGTGDQHDKKNTDYIYLLGKKTVKSHYFIRFGLVGACETKHHYN